MVFIIKEFFCHTFFFLKKKYKKICRLKIILYFCIREINQKELTN